MLRADSILTNSSQATHYVKEFKKKLVIVGDGECGKTCLLMAQTGEQFKWEYCPTVFDNFTSTIHVNNKIVLLSLWDTAGQEGSWESYHSVINRWVPEIKHFLGAVDMILVGTKKDLRDDYFIPSGSLKCVSTQDGLKACEAIGAAHYFECSALRGEGVGEIFEAGARLLLKNKSKKRVRNEKCILL